jgi:tetratricopeptide (TPR) repeat protein
MKYPFLLFLLLPVFNIVFAQQTVNTDNALLLNYYQDQRFGDAYDYLKKNYPEPVNDTKALANLAYASRMAGKLADAENYYQRFYDKDSSNISVLFNLGSINVSRGNKEKAVSYYKKILATDSTNFSVYKQLAALSQSLYDTVTYANYLQKANALNPQEPDIAYDLARLYIAFIKYEKAAMVLDKAVQADTANLILMKGQAEVNFLLKKYPETINNCVKLIQSGEKNAFVVNWLGISCFRLRQYRQCISAFQLLSNDMQSEATYYYIAMSYKALNDQPNTVIYLQNSIKQAISPNVANYYSELADSYDRLHQLKKAATAYQKSLQFNETPLIYYSLAFLYDTQLRNKKSALRYYKKYLASKPPKEEQKYMDYTNSRIPALAN